MNPKVPLYKMPVPSTELEGGGACMVHNSIRFEFYRNGELYRTGIRFSTIRATRTHSEPSCTAWHIEGAYDTLVEIENSPWVAELQADTADRQRRLGEKWDLHHYMIYLDSFGCFEVIAASWDVIPAERGSWLVRL